VDTAQSTEIQAPGAIEAGDTLMLAGAKGTGATGGAADTVTVIEFVDSAQLYESSDDLNIPDLVM